MQICPACGEELPDRYRVCGVCGTQLAAPEPVREVRKTVTVVFCDLKGSTALAERLDSESLREVLDRYFDAMRRALELHGGTVEKYIGDAVMAVFGLPTVHEDDALRAVRAAAEMQRALIELNRDLERDRGVTLTNRTGVNTGEVVAGDAGSRQRLVTGDAVNVAARLEQAAGPMEVLLGDLTHRLVQGSVTTEPVEPLELKGKSERVPAHRLIAVDQQTVYRRSHDAPMVGRTAELAQMLGALDEAAAERRCRTVLLLGEAGLGKSRLASELVRAGGGARALRGRCLPYGDGITFWPLVEAVHDAARIEDADDPASARAKLADLLGNDGEVWERIASAIGLSEAHHSLDEIAWAAARVVERLAADGPLVLVFEDVHWAEPAFLDLLAHLDATVSAPVLLLCTARGEFLDDRPDWAAPAGTVTIRLLPLSREEGGRVLANLLGDVPLEPEARERLVESADGNPLYAEQLLSMLIDQGSLRRDPQGWVAAGGTLDLAVPPTIAALLAARLDRLPPGERAVIEPASVIGQLFHSESLAELTPAPAGVADGLASLTTKQFVRPEPRSTDGDHRFHHILIRDATYAGMLKRARSDLHERYAAVVRERAGDRLMEFDEILGYHLEQAYRYRHELGSGDAGLSQIGSLAAGHLASAGRRAFQRGDMSAAATLLRRAVALLPPGSAERIELLPDLGEVLADMGAFDEADALLAEAVEEEAAGERLSAQARIVRSLVRFSIDPEGRGAQALAEAERSLPVLERLGDHAGQCRAWRLVATVHGHACRFGDAERAAREATEHARLAGDTRQENRTITSFAMAALYGPRPVPEAIAQCEQLAALGHGDRRTEGLVLCALANLYAMDGDFDRARTVCGRARRLLAELGGVVLTASTALDASRIELLAGDPAAAEAALRRDYPALERVGERYYLASMAALLAQSLLAQGRTAEAATQAADAERWSAEDDVEAQVLWRSVQARLRAAAGDGATAAALAAEAVDLAREADSPAMQADALTDLALVLEAGGHTAEAGAAARDAARLYAVKASAVSGRAARAIADRLATPTG